MLTALQAKKISDRSYSIQLQKAIKRKEEITSETIKLLPNILKRVEEVASNEDDPTYCMDITDNWEVYCLDRSFGLLQSLGYKWQLVNVGNTQKGIISWD